MGCPEITFGYGQKADWVCDETGRSIDSITRRPTGEVSCGMAQISPIVWLPREEAGLNKCHRCNFMVSFTKNGQKHFGGQGIDCSLMPCPQQSKSNIPSDCFKEPVGRDLMDSSAKEKLEEPR